VISVNKKYYLAADGGGSKVQAVLYDEEFNVIKTGTMTGTTTLFKPEETIHAEMDEMLDELLNNVNQLQSVDHCILGSSDYFEKAISERCEVSSFNRCHEPHMGIASAFYETGVLALSGTGSDAFVIKKGKTTMVVGGWGPLFGDEGSGYDIGLNSIKALMYEWDGRRPPTMMSKMILEKFEVESPWEIVFKMNRNPNARQEIASVTRITSKAANMGDKVALDIYRHAAHELSLQVIAAIHRSKEDIDGPIIAMGGAWKGCTYMFEAFSHEVHGVFPDFEIIRPKHDPVVGCVVIRARRDGLEMEEIKRKIGNKFDCYLYE